MTYTLRQIEYSTTITDLVLVNKDYQVLGISQKLTGINPPNFFTPRSNPCLAILDNTQSLGTVNLSFFSIKMDVSNTVEANFDGATYVGTYSVTDDAIYGLWYEEVPTENEFFSDFTLNLKADGGMNRNESLEVSQWEDHSTQSNNFYNDSVNKPVYAPNEINELPSIYFTGGNKYLQSYYTDDFTDLTEGLSLFFVLKPDPLNVGHFLLNCAASASVPDKSFSISISTNFNNTSIVRFSTYPADIETYLETTALWDSQYQLLEITYNGTDTANIYVNGNLLASGTVGTIPTIERLYNFIGNDSSATQGYYGYIAEVLVYKTEVSSDTRKDIEGYLNNKYSLGSVKPQITPPGVNVEGTSGPIVTLLGPPGTPIYWTDDGKDPTAASTLYIEPFTITKNSFIKAKAIGLFGPSEVEKALIIIGTGGGA